VQPAVRRATGREDIWGIGVPMSVDAAETWMFFRQFMIVYDADYVTRDGRFVIDGPEIRQRLIRAMESYTALYRKGCTRRMR
jgi:multiple sugar transport system substrate-binding protein